MTQQPSALPVLEGDSSKTAAIDIGHAIVPSQPLIDKRIVGAKQIDHAAITADLALQEQLGFLLEGVPEVLIEFGKIIGARCHTTKLRQINPLASEIVDQRLSRDLGQHAPHLFVQELRFVKLPAHGEIEQLVVGNAAPQKK